MEGWYYLHTNGSLIYKRELGSTAADIRESDCARAMWPIDPSNREGAWRIVVEGLAAGANPERVQELAKKWDCSDEDGLIYAKHVGARVERDGDKWMATRRDFENLQESPAGFGASIIEAMSDLAKKLGYMPSKMWGASFSDLLRL